MIVRAELSLAGTFNIKIYIYFQMDEHEQYIVRKNLKRDCEEELASPTLYRFDSNVAAVQVYYLLGDGQAQARAATLLHLTRASRCEVLK